MALGKVSLDLEVKIAKLEKDLKLATRSIDKNTKTMSRTSKKNFDRMERNAKQMAGAIRFLVAGAMAAMVKTTINAADEIGKMSTRLGISTEALSQLRLVAEKGGIEFRTLTMGLQRMTRRVSEAAAGTGEAKKALEELGISATKLNQLAPEQQFEVIADALSGVDNQADRVRLAMRFFDSEGVSILQTFGDEGGAGIRRVREEADALGQTISQETADKAAQFNDAITEMQAALSGFLTEALLPLIPRLTETAEGLATLTAKAHEFINALQGNEKEVKTLRGQLEAHRETVSKNLAEQGRLLEALEEGRKELEEGSKEWITYGLEIVNAKLRIKELQQQLNDANDDVDSYSDNIKNAGEESEDAAAKAKELADVLGGNGNGSVASSAKTAADHVSDYMIILSGYVDDVIAASYESSVYGKWLASGSDSVAKSAEEAAAAIEYNTETLKDNKKAAEEAAQAAADLARAQQGAGEGLGAIFNIAGIQGANGIADILGDFIGSQNEGLGNALGQFAEGAGIGGQIGGIMSQFGMHDTDIGSAIGGGIGMAFGPIGSLVGGLLGGVIGNLTGSSLDDTPGPSELIFGSSSIDNRRRPGPGDKPFDAFTDALIRGGGTAFRDQLQPVAIQLAETFFDTLGTVLTPEQIQEAASILEGRTFDVQPEDVQSGAFLEPVLDAIIPVLEPAVARLVSQFDGMEDKFQAIQAAQAMFAAMDADAIGAAEAMIEAMDRTALESAQNTASAIRDMGAEFDGSIDSMQRITAAMGDFGRQVAQTLINIENARRQIGNITGSTVDQLRFTVLGNQDQADNGDRQFEFLTRRAEQLAAGIGDMTDPQQIANTVAQVNQLTQQAFGLATPEEQERMLAQFTSFLESVDVNAQSQLDVIQSEIEATYDQLQEDMRQTLTNFVEQLQPVADGLGSAAGGFGRGVGEFNRGVGRIEKAAIDFEAAASQPVQVVVNGGFAREIGA